MISYFILAGWIAFNYLLLSTIFYIENDYTTPVVVGKKKKLPIQSMQFHAICMHRNMNCFLVRIYIAKVDSFLYNYTLFSTFNTNTLHPLYTHYTNFRDIWKNLFDIAEKK